MSTQEQLDQERRIIASATEGPWEESWRQVPGFEGYEVSDFGNVRSYLARGSHKVKRAEYPRTTTTTHDGKEPHMSEIKHTDEERVWTGDPEKHADEVWDLVYIHGYVHQPWDTYEVLCDQPMCIQFEHIKVISPKRLEYPNRICVYCGVPSGTRDHLIPNTRTGPSVRKHVLTVPACSQCNSILGEREGSAIDTRRRYVQNRLAKKHWKVLAYEKPSPEELDEYGPTLRAVIEGGVHERERLEARLMWPDDPHYDIRYLQKSGYEHPLETGLLTVTPEEAERERAERLEQHALAARRNRLSKAA